MGQPLIDGKNNPIPEEVVEKTSKRYFPMVMDPKDYKYIGKNVPRKEAREIVTGKAVFTDDYMVPGMIYGKCKKSPYPHALIKSIRTEKAKALTGVRAVLTYEDLNEMEMNPMLGWPPQKPLMDQHLR